VAAVVVDEPPVVGDDPPPANPFGTHGTISDSRHAFSAAWPIASHAVASVCVAAHSHDHAITQFELGERRVEVDGTQTSER